MILSLRGQIDETFGPGIDLSGGLRQSFFSPLYLERPDFYPYQSQGKISLRKTIEGWKWPAQSDYMQLPDHPEDKRTTYATKLQGVTHVDDRCWIFSQDPDGVQGQITAMGVNQDIDTSSGGSLSVSTVITEENRTEFRDNAHYGDCSYDDGILIVPNHDDAPNILVSYQISFNYTNPNNPRYNLPSITYLGVTQFQAPLSYGGASVPWVSFVPSSLIGYGANKRVLISSFFRNYPNLDSREAKNGPNIFFYELITNTTPPSIVDPGLIPDFDPNLPEEDQSIQYPLEFKNRNGNFLDLRRIQGGVVSPAGHLYLSCDLKTGDDVEAAGGGLHGIDLVTGRRIIYLPVNGNQRGINDIPLFELEGVDIWDLDAISNKPATSRGQIHLTVLRPRFPSGDTVWVLHWRVTDISKRIFV